MPKKDFEGKFSLAEEGHAIGITGGNGALGLVVGEWLLMQVEKDRASTHVQHCQQEKC